MPKGIGTLFLSVLTGSRAGVKDGHVEGHVHQHAGDAGLADAVQQGQIRLGLQLCAGIKDDAGVGGHRGRQDGEVPLHRDTCAPGHHLQRHIFRPVIVRHVPEKGPRAQRGHRRRDARRCQQLFSDRMFHASIPLILLYAAAAALRAKSITAVLPLLYHTFGGPRQPGRAPKQDRPAKQRQSAPRRRPGALCKRCLRSVFMEEVFLPSAHLKSGLGVGNAASQSCSQPVSMPWKRSTRSGCWAATSFFSATSVSRSNRWRLLSS